MKKAATLKANEKATASKSEGRGIQSIEIGARMLGVMVAEAEPLMLKDLARLAGVTPAQAHAYLSSFRKMGLVEQEAAAGRYRLGPFALELGISRMRTLDMFRIAREAVVALSQDTALNVAMVVWGTFGPTVIQVQESGSQLNMNTREGTVYSISGTASGRAFAAHLPDPLIKEAIRAERRDDATGIRVGKPRYLSRAELDEIREAGFATVEDPPVPGINAVSAPVFDHLGQMQLAITIIGVVSVLETTSENPYVQRLLATTEHLSHELGYSRSQRSRRA